MEALPFIALPEVRATFQLAYGLRVACWELCEAVRLIGPVCSILLEGYTVACDAYQKRILLPLPRSRPYILIYWLTLSITTFLLFTGMYLAFKYYVKRHTTSE